MSVIKNQRKGQQFSISGQTTEQLNTWLADKIANEHMSNAVAKQIIKGFIDQQLLG